MMEVKGALRCMESTSILICIMMCSYVNIHCTIKFSKHMHTTWTSLNVANLIGMVLLELLHIRIK